MASEKSIYNIGISMLQMLGEKLSYTSRKLWIFRTFNCAVFITLLLFTIINVIRIENKMNTRTIESVLGVLHPLLKYFLIIYHKSDFHFLINTYLKQFWKDEHFYADILNVNKNLYKLVKLIQIGTIVIGYIAIYAWFFRPLLAGKGAYPMETWVFGNSTVANCILIITEFYLSYFMAPSVFGYDLFYLSLCVDVRIGVRLLKSKLLHFSIVSPGRRMEEIKICTKHHQLLLRAFTRMKHIFSTMLLFHYFVTMTLSCVEIYQLMLRRTSSTHTVQKVINVFIIFAEFAFYTFPAEALTSELSDVSNKIYMSSWYENNLIIQKQLLVMMTQCQRRNYFTGGGIIQINVETFASVIRKALSVGTVLRNFLNN